MNRTVAAMLNPKARGLYRLRQRTALDEWGWYDSIKHGFPCDKNGQPIPWISYPAISLLRSRVKSEWDVFEFGAGYSTLWWGRHCRSVTSSEHDAIWSEKLAHQLPANCSVLSVRLDSDYPLAAKSTNRKYDVIVVDGRKRVRCALSSVDCLKEAGVIVWDDTDREFYQQGLRKLTDLGFRRIDLVGMSPLEIDPKQTSIMYRSTNVLGI
jgi:hypothetical protein